MILNEISKKPHRMLREFEVELKLLHEKNAARNLEIPHQMDEILDILQMANLRSQNNYATLLLHQHLEEDLFFNDDANVELYQHFRYLPAYYHSHSFFEIACVLSGSCDNYIAEGKIHMEAGDICIIAPDTIHAISAFSDECIMVNLLLRTSSFETAFFGVLSENDILSDFFMRTLYHQSSHPYLLFCTGADTELQGYVSQALQEFSRNRQYKKRMLGSIVDLFLITLLRNHGSDVIFPASGSKQENENTILILKYLQEHYNTVTLLELSRFFNYSERQLQRIIKESTGMSFSQNVQKLKLRRAEHLMQNPDLSIADISRELGFASPENFRHVFKKYYGVTPVEYRSVLN